MVFGALDDSLSVWRSVACRDLRHPVSTRGATAVVWAKTGGVTTLIATCTAVVTAAQIVLPGERRVSRVEELRDLVDDAIMLDRQDAVTDAGQVVASSRREPVGGGARDLP